MASLCRLKIHGRIKTFVINCNPYKARIDAAAALYKSGKVKYLLVSGDNGRVLYDEPTAMRKDLIQKGVPRENIVCDFAGFRTLDSIIRAQKVFVLKECLIISQHFHNERALYLADATSLKAFAIDATDPPDSIEARLWWRERFSRLTAVLDVNLWKTQPRYLGPPIAIGSHREDPLFT
ncbi:MAG: ElyC/SanA/YdcF family protein [bacterium]